MVKSKTAKQIREAYTNPESGLSGITKKFPDVDTEDIKKSLEAVDAYTLHKLVKKNFERRKVYVNGIDKQWQADLVDMSRHAKVNDNYKFLLTVIDVFSKHAWGIPLKNKTAKSVVNAFTEIFEESGRVPQKIQTDDGSEFFNKDIKALFDKYNIHLFSTNSELKATIVERFNRTLKEKMFKYFELTQSFRYLDALPTLLKNYNNSYHSSIKMKPTEVTESNSSEVCKNLYDLNQNHQNLKWGIMLEYQMQLIFSPSHMRSRSIHYFRSATHKPSDL
eukprot:Lithocolla_globosa_v1_NODE_1648_length_2420_cov_156.284144.p1 type:complete len:277 gc:universal NODE_1648_length_2420_cov_156.284144:1493-663(-)